MDERDKANLQSRLGSRLTEAGIDYESISGVGENCRIDLENEKDRTKAEELKKSHAWNEPTEEEQAEEADRAEFARYKPMLEAAIEAMKDPTNVTSKAVMRDAERKHAEKKKAERNDSKRTNRVQSDGKN